jgi:flagellar M-ring protein FliF
MPEPSLYTQEKKDPTASVVLKLKPGRKPTADQIKGISHLVSGSVEGLKPENLTIVDSSGKILNIATSPDATGLQASAAQIDIQRQVETTLERAILLMLERVLGPNKAAVKVTASLDFDKVETNAETFSPKGTTPQIRSERKLTDSQSSQGATPGGVPGTDANVPGYQAVQGNAQSSRQMTDTTINYEISKTVDKIVRAPGSIKNLAVAVVLDQQDPVASAQAETIQQIVATAAAIDTNRGDRVTVSALPFDRTAAENEQAALDAAAQRDQLLAYLRLGALVVVPLLVIIGLLIAVRMGRRPLPRELAPALPGPGVMPDGSPGRPVVTDVMETDKLLREAEKKDPTFEQVEFLARNNPNIVAQLMRTWLQDPERG